MTICHKAFSFKCKLIYLSSFVKSRSNPFLEPTSTEQWVFSFLTNDTTGVWNEVRTYDWQASTDNELDAWTTAPLWYM